MRLVNLLVLSFLLCGISGASINQQTKGYLVQNLSRPLHCYDLPSNKQCPPDIVDYEVIGYDSQLNLTKDGLASVKLTVGALDFFKVDETCRESVREYACSNTLPICKEGHGGPSVMYDVQKTEKACAKAREVCPIEAQKATIADCKFINRDPMEYATCVSLPEVPDNVCKNMHYKYPKPNAAWYPMYVEALKKTLAAMKPFLNASCLDGYRVVNCLLVSGPLCSDDMTLRIRVMNKQECTAIMTRCLPGQDYFLTMCDLFPDQSAKKVPLPSLPYNFNMV